MKKKILGIILALVLTLSLAACSGNASPTPPPATQPPVTQPSVTEPAQSAPPAATVDPENPVIVRPGQGNPSGENDAPTVGTQSVDLDAMSLSDVMAAILKDVPDLPETMETELDADTFEFTAFVPYSEGMEGLVSEALINAVAHSVVLVRVPEGTDVGEVADTMAANMNPRKWVCVEAESASVTVRGNTVLLVLSNETAAKQIVDNFNAL